MSAEEGKDKLSESMEDNKLLFIQYTRELVEIIVKFNLLALDNFRTSVGHPLHSMDISKIIRREIQYVADTILQEDYMAIIEERTKALYANS